MGGCVCYAFDGKYCIIYDDGDGIVNPGVRLVREIPTDYVAFREWRNSKIREFKEGKINGVKVTDKPPRFKDTIPNSYGGVDWIYYVGLDNHQFSLDSSAIFRLDNIPRGPNHTDWIKYIQVDGSGNRCLHPSTPNEIRGVVYPFIDPLVPIETWRAYAASDPKILDPSIWLSSAEGRSVLNELSLFAFKASLENRYGMFCLACHFEPDREEFQTPAKFLLTQLAPGILHILSEHEDFLLLGNNHVQRELKAREKSARSTGPWKSRGLPIRWWFRNRLVILASRLDESTYFEGWIWLAVQAVRKRRRSKEEMVVLLWSVRHAAVVTVSESGVSHTPAFPILDAYGKDDLAFTNGVDILMHFLQPACIHLTATTSTPDNSSDNNNTGSLDVDDESRPKISLPFDIVTRILDDVDTETYNACSMLSKVYRSNWASHPRAGRFKLFRAKPKPSTRKVPEFPHTVGALDVSGLTSAPLQRMFLFSTGFPRDKRLSRYAWDDSFTIHLPMYDPTYFLHNNRLQKFARGFVEATVSEINSDFYHKREDYLLPEDRFKSYPKKGAFHLDVKMVDQCYCTCNPRWPLEVG